MVRYGISMPSPKTVATDQTAKRHPWLVALLCSALTPTQAPATAGPERGRRITAEEMVSLTAPVFPDGAGLPPGQGNGRDGQALYESRCAACHGARGTGGSAEELAGGGHGLRDDPPDKTIGTYWPFATTLFDYIRRAMPPEAPGSLSADQTYALTAYILALNGLIGSTASLDAATLPRVRMPNRDGFIPVDAR